MHQSSLDNMEKVIQELAPYLDKENDIFDLGGGGKLERSYKGLWKNYTKEYFIGDIVDAPSVTHLLKQPYLIPEVNDRFDIVVSGQTLEHIANPFKIFDELCRVLKPNGIIVILSLIHI